MDMTAALSGSWLGSWIRFDQPLWLIATAAAMAPVAVAILFRRRGGVVGAAGVAMRAAAIALAAVALARPALPVGEKSARPWLVVQDVSASTRQQNERPLELPPDLRQETHGFAQTVLAAGQKPFGDATNLSPALRLAAARSKDLAGVILRTDGQFTDEAQWPAAAAALGATGLEVLIVPMESPPPDARISEFSAARRPGGQVELRVTAASNAFQRRPILVYRQGQPRNVLLDREVALAGGEAATFHLRDQPPAGAAAIYRASLGGTDAFPENDSAEAMVLPEQKRLAVVSGGELGAAALASRLGFAVNEISPAAAPQEAEGWLDCSAVLLADAEGTLLDDRQRAALSEYVLGGGGLLLIGSGPHRTAEDRDDPLNRVAALVANPFERRPLKVTVILDASGSMAEPAEGASAGQVKFDLAAQAVLSLRRHLTGHDRLRVITFSDFPRRLYDSGTGPPDFAAMAEALSPVRPGGPTKVVPALDEAAASTPEQGMDGLLLVVSDLGTQDAGVDVPALARRIKDRRWQLAVVVTTRGSESQPAGATLEALAARLGAPLVRAEKLTGLADVFARFLRQARGEAVRRGQFQVKAQEMLLGRARGPLPQASAYILCGAADGADVLAAIGDDPILARRRAGLGRSMSLALPPQFLWRAPADSTNPDWRAWPGLEDFLAAAVEWASRPGQDPRFYADLQPKEGTGAIRVTAADRNGPINLLKLKALVQSLAQPRRVEEVALDQVGPGLYEATLPEGSEGAGVALCQEDGKVVWQGSVPAGPAMEFERIGANWPNLRRLADLAEARIVSQRALASLARRLGARRFEAVWPYTLAAAVAMMLLEWSRTRLCRRRHPQTRTP